MTPRMLLSLTSASFAQQAVIVKKMGFDGIDYKASIGDLFIHYQVHLQAKKNGIPILSLHQPRWLIPYTPTFLFPRMIRLALQFPDLQVMNHHLSGVYNLLSHKKELRIYLSLVKQKKFVCSFESNPNTLINHLFPLATYSPKAFAAFGQEHNLFLTLDTAHIAANGYDIVQFFEENFTRIAVIHLSDYKDGVGHLPLGKGNLPLLKLFHAIRTMKWNKLIILEIKTFPASSTAEEKQLILLESLRLAKKYLKD